MCRTATSISDPGNYRTKADAALREETVAGLMDVRDNPLVPILRGGYMIAFEPSEAWVQRAQRGITWNYLDDKKVVMVDLSRLPGEKNP